MMETTVGAPAVTARILVVEDERKVAKAIRDGLEAEEFEVSVAHSGEEGFFLVNEHDYDLILLDLMLPGRDGFHVLETLRRRGLQTPVLVLTALDSVADRVKGLDCGADDYLGKPFAVPELLARVRALLRRGRVETVHRLRADDLDMDLLTRRTTRGGNLIDLTTREYELLEYLMRNQGRVVSREMLARDVWKETTRATPIDNVIDVHMTRLRRKIDDPFENKLIRTVRGVGFIIGDQPPA